MGLRVTQVILYIIMVDGSCKIPLIYTKKCRWEWLAVVQVGVMAPEDKEPPLPMGPVMFNELEIVGSHGIQAYEYGKVLDLITGGRLDPQKLIGKTVSLEESIAELEAMGEFRNVGVTVIDRF